MTTGSSSFKDKVASENLGKLIQLLLERYQKSTVNAEFIFRNMKFQSVLPQIMKTSVAYFQDLELNVYTDMIQ